jgi:hypothetical protein
VHLLGGDATRVVLGGNSQGGTVSLHAAISYGRPLGGLLCLRSCLVETVTIPRDRCAVAPWIAPTPPPSCHHTPSSSNTQLLQLTILSVPIPSSIPPCAMAFTPHVFNAQTERCEPDSRFRLRMW